MLLTEEKSDQFAKGLRQAVDQALLARNLSARRASLDVVGHDGLIRDIRAGRIPSADRVAALFNYLGLEAYFGPRRAAPIAATQAVANSDPDDHAPAGFITVPWAEVGARPGSAPIAFSRHWVTDHKLLPDFLQAAIPDVISLPGPHPADTVALLDSRIGQRKGHNLWCFRDAGQVRVAHITFIDQLAVIHPAEPGQPKIVEEPVARELSLLGKVVWMGQSVPFKGRID
jgi:hypothetical protein